MSLFGSMIGDFEDDPIFGSHMQSMQHMNSMMNSMFNNPFGMMAPALMGPAPNGRGGDRHSQMMPYGFPMGPLNMNDMFAGFNNMAPGQNCQGMSSMSMMTYTQGPDGRPQVYQASRSTRAAPGGLKETQESVYDSRTGTKKLAIGHHIGERAHVIEKQKNLHNGDEEEHQEFINLDEEEADTFNQEWETRTRGRASRPNLALEDSQSHHKKSIEPKRLALTDGTTSNRHSSRSSRTPTQRRIVRPLSSSGIDDPSRADTSDSRSQGEKRAISPETSGSRKRERNEETETSSKRHMTSNQD